MQQFAVSNFAAAYFNSHMEAGKDPLPVDAFMAFQLEKPRENQEAVRLRKLFEERMLAKRLKAIADGK